MAANRERFSKPVSASVDLVIIEMREEPDTENRP
jgi:hypothetical protein